ncbi:NAD(P)-binding protein [Exidia glandulosa HHB12029]|uniref:NAD(P)-binding protein n=1 Tax=Exidia glandulosa HHB12029 TaxID=1314781 RepID=A0A165ZFX1_EXIGL|nr:NAD(P)-binding protein [Exidia glandulosa HHB12029]
MSKRVFILGTTGYIGGKLRSWTLRCWSQIYWHYTALVRNSKDFNAVQDAGADDILHASHSDLEKVQAAASKADIVINCADSDDLPLTNAILAGLEAHGGRPILVHTSGTGVIQDKAEGEFTKYAEKIWNDNSEEDIKSIDKDQPHREIDLAIFAADEAKKVNAYIIAPATIYGIANGPVHRISQQIPTVVRTSVQLGKALYVGQGKNLWNNVHIDDLVELYDLVLKRALSGADNHASPYAKWYFGSIGEHCWGDVDRAIGKILFEKGLVPNKVAESVKFSDIKHTAPLLKYVATNSRSKADRGFALGWKPSAPSLEASLKADVEATLKGL